MTFKLLLEIGFWIIWVGLTYLLICELISGPQKKFWQYKRADKKRKKLTKMSKYAGSVLVGW